MKLSIITINYNNKEGLRHTIESVIVQTYRAFQWIIIDGDSTDGSKELLKQYEEHFSYCCSEPDKGIYNAMNKGIERATGEYCFFLNSGDRLHDKHVIKNVIGKMDGTDFVSGNVWCVNDNYEFIKIYKTPEQLSKYYMLELTLGHQCTFIRTYMLKNHPYDESLSIVADWEEMFYEFFFNERSYKHIDEIISDYPVGGVADQNLSLLAIERKTVRDKYLSRKEQDLILMQHFSSCGDVGYSRRLIEVAYTAFANQCYQSTEYQEVFGKYAKKMEKSGTWYQRFFVKMCLVGKMNIAFYLYKLIFSFKERI